MDYSDIENASDGDEPFDDILGMEDLFNDEAEEDNDRDAEDKAEKKDQDSKVKVESKIKPKRVVRNTRNPLNFDTLKRPQGLRALKKLFNDFKFKGTNHEEEDLTRIMGILKQWMTYQLCPSYDFESCMLQLEALGKKKVVQTYMKKVRMGLDEWGEDKSDVKDSSMDNPVDVQKDNFYLLIQEGMANIDSEDEISQNEINPLQNESHITQNEAEVTLAPEQLERIAKNRKLAEERRLKRMKECRNVTAEATENDNSQIPSEQINLEENS